MPETQTDDWQAPPGPGHDCALGPGTQTPRTSHPATALSKRRWDELNREQRRKWSTELARREALAQGLPPVASAEQHRAIARILGASNSAEGGGSGAKQSA